MKRKSIFTKMMALFMAGAMGMMAMGCSAGQSAETSERQTDNDARISESGNTGSDTAQKDYADSNGMGRYMEKTVLEVEGATDRMQLQILADGQIVFLNYLSDQRFQSGDGGDNWEKVEDETFSSYIKDHYAIAAAVSKDGTIAIINMEKKEGQENSEHTDYDYVLNIYNPDSNSESIVKNIPITLPSADCRLYDLTFGEDGRLFVGASACNSVFEVDIEAGTAKKLVDLPERTELTSCRDGILLCAGYEKTYLYDLNKGSLIEDEVLNDFLKENYGGVSWYGSGFSAYPFLGEDNSIYIAGEKGLYRHVLNGNAMEQVIDGSLSTFGDPSHEIMAVLENDNQEFFAAFSDGKIIRFTYDATISAVPNEKLTIYSLNEDDMVKQAVSAYRAVYPDMYIDYEIGMDGDGVTREDALKKLNTKLLSGEGPDVLILDGMNIDTYAEKGVLMDLSDIVSEVNQRDGLYMNLIEPFYQGSSLYAVPVQFRIPVIGGREDTLKNVNDYQSLADMIETVRAENPDANLLGIGSESGIMKRLIPVCEPSWKTDDGQVDEEKIREFLQQTKRIYEAQMNGTPQEYIEMYQQNVLNDDGTNYENDPYFMMLMDTFYLMGESPFMFGELLTASVYLDMISMPRIEGFEDTVYQRMDGQCSNVYHPNVIVAINAATNNAEQAKEFVRTMLGTSVQDNPHVGLPINKKSLAKQFEYDEKDLGDDGGLYYISFSSKDGGRVGMTIYPAEPEDVADLEKWIAELDTPYLCDAVLEDVVFAEGGKYLIGNQDLDAAVKAIMDSVAIYMEE